METGHRPHARRPNVVQRPTSSNLPLLEPGRAGLESIPRRDWNDTANPSPFVAHSSMLDLLDDNGETSLWPDPSRLLALTETLSIVKGFFKEHQLESYCVAPSSPKEQNPVAVFGVFCQQHIFFL